MTNKHKEVKDQDWLNDLPPTALLCKKDILKIFGYSTIQSIANAINKKVFPRPDFKFKGGFSNRPAKVYWKLETIKKEMKRRIELEKLKNLYAENGNGSNLVD